MTRKENMEVGTEESEYTAFVKPILQIWVEEDELQQEIKKMGWREWRQSRNVSCQGGQAGPIPKESVDSKAQ